MDKKDFFTDEMLKLNILQKIEVQVKEIIAEMQKYGLNQNDVCQDLGFNKGDLSSYLSEKKPLPKSRLKAFFWYFRYKELSSRGGS